MFDGVKLQASLVEYLVSTCPLDPNQVKKLFLMWTRFKDILIEIVLKQPFKIEFNNANQSLKPIKVVKISQIKTKLIDNAVKYFNTKNVNPHQETEQDRKLNLILSKVDILHHHQHLPLPHQHPNEFSFKFGKLSGS